MNENHKMAEQRLKLLALNVLLTMHSTHFIYGYMVPNHSDNERGNLLLPHGLLFLISSKVFLNMHHPTDRIAHSVAFVNPVIK